HRELVYRPLQLQKRSQLFIGTHDETLSVAMRVRNPDRSALLFFRLLASAFSHRTASIRSSSSRTIAAFVAALALAVNGLFGSVATAEQSPDSFSVTTFPAGESPWGLAFDGANIWIADFFGNAVIKMRASDGV